MSGVRTILGCPYYPGILSIQESRASGVRTILGYPQYPGILSIQGSRDPGHLVSGQSWNVLSILGYLVFKDPGIQGSRASGVGTIPGYPQYPGMYTGPFLILVMGFLPIKVPYTTVGATVLGLQNSLELPPICCGSTGHHSYSTV